MHLNTSQKTRKTKIKSLRVAASSCFVPSIGTQIHPLCHANSRQINLCINIKHFAQLIYILPVLKTITNSLDDILLVKQMLHSHDIMMLLNLTSLPSGFTVKK